MPAKALEPNAPLVLSRSAVFRVRSHAEVEFDVGGVFGTLPMSLYQLALRFSESRSLEQLRAELPADGAGHDIADTVRPLLEQGILGLAGAPREAGQSVASILHPKTFADPTLMQRIGKAVAAGHAVVVPNAFEEGLANRIHARLEESAHWQANEGVLREPFRFRHDNFFHFRHRNIFEDQFLPDDALACQSVLASRATKELMSEITGTDCRGPLEFAASQYLPGDYSLPHCDDSRERSIAYVWHLTKDWRPEWGGDFVWCPTGAVTSPTFNSLLLFHVTERSLHFVSPVSPRAQGRRMAINGWWNASTPRPATSDDFTKWPVPMAPGTYGGGSKLLDGRDDVVVL